MFRSLKLLALSFFCGALLSVASGWVGAETIAATAVAEFRWGGQNSMAEFPALSFEAHMAARCGTNPSLTFIHPAGQNVSTATSMSFFCNGSLATARKYCYLSGAVFSSSCTTSNSCPAGQNWTLAGSSCTRPDCVSPQTRNASTGVCEAPSCTSKTAVGGSQYFDMGTSASASFPGVVCAAGCLAVFSGSAPASSAVVAGVKRYYAKGSYTFAGGGSQDQCTPGVAAPGIGSGLDVLPVSRCAANQIEGMINGKLNCWNVPGSGVAPVAAPTEAPVTTAGPTTSTSTSTVNNTTTTTEITNNPGGGQMTTTTVCTDGNCVKSVSETKTGEEAAEGTPQAGTLGEVTALAEDDERTIASVWAARRAELSASPLFALASSLTSFPGVSANCPSWSLTGNIFGHSTGGSFAPPCWIWAVLRAFLLITALFVARRMIFGG